MSKEEIMQRYGAIQALSEEEVLAARPAGKQLYSIYARYRQGFIVAGHDGKVLWLTWFTDFQAALADAKRVDGIGVVECYAVVHRPDLEINTQMLRATNGMCWSL